MTRCHAITRPGLRTRATLVAAALVVGAGCGGDGADIAATATPRSTAVASPEPPAAAPGDSVEVTGLVGAVGASGDIAINRLSGAAVDTVVVVESTRIVSPNGERLTLAEVRPSERLIARGRLDRATGTLIAESITVQAPGPGAPPLG